MDMKKIVLGIVIAAFAFQAYQRVQEPESLPAPEAVALPDPHLVERPAAQAAENTSFRCDGRTHCSQMNSCEEATYFLRNCPNVEMDGNNDGVPCEKQWCRSGMPR
jgi:hypothetical protein